MVSHVRYTVQFFILMGENRKAINSLCYVINNCRSPIGSVGGDAFKVLHLSPPPSSRKKAKNIPGLSGT
jgi:hypothetical protein